MLGLYKHTVLVGIATILVDADPQQAHAILAIVENRPVVMSENQQHIIEVQTLLMSRYENTGTRTTSEPTDMLSLQTVVTTLLKNHNDRSYRNIASLPQITFCQSF